MTVNSLVSAVGATPRVLADYYRSQIFWDQVPWALIALAIGVGGLIAFWVCIKLAEVWTNSLSTKRYKWFKAQKEHIEKTTHSKNSLIRLFFLLIGLGILLSSFWVASSTAGFNFWTVFLGYGILSLIGTYAFGSTLKNFGAFFLINITNKIEENWIVTVGNYPRGRIVAIHILWVELVPEMDVENQVPTSVTQIPTWTFLDAAVKHELSVEAAAFRQRPTSNAIVY